MNAAATQLETVLQMSVPGTMMEDVPAHLLTTPLVGRDTELDDLARLVGLAPQGGGAPGAPGGFVRRTSVRTINGQREIEVQDGGKITKVRDVPGGGIEGQVTETVNGKETTRKVEAKDLQDLKQKDAELAKVYEQFQPPAAAPRNPARVPNPFE